MGRSGRNSGLGRRASGDVKTSRRSGAGAKLARAAARTKLAFVMVLLDVTLVSGGYLLLMVLRFDASIPDQYWRSFAGFLLAAAIVHIGVNAAYGLYSEIWRYASTNEARRVFAAGLTTILVLTTVTMFNRSRIPLSVPVIGGVLATGSIGILRFQSRLFSLGRRSNREDARRIAVVGAGEAAGHLLREIRRSPGLYEPVIVLDDDPRKWGMTLLGCPVVGPLERLPEVAATGRLDAILLAIPEASSALIRRVEAISEACSLPLLMLPRVADLLGSAPSMRDVRDLEISDLLGRTEVETDLAAVAALVEGRTVLVTGAGGSIGSEIVRQVSAFAPKILVLVDSDDTHLHDARAKVEPGVPCRSELVNIRDRERVRQVFATYRPDVVLHAAALKHVPVLEANAREAVMTNVFGLDTVISAAVDCAVEHFVFISTDKAVKPSSVMGATKWMGEQMVLTRAPKGSSWCCVRFGNVLGSRGSVLPTFERQIRQGGPVTVTDERMTRYFMSVQEAVQLVLQAAALPGERSVYMLEMGDPVSIAELARKMIRLSGKEVGRDIEIVYSGIRPGEKLTEELHTESEELKPVHHPSIRLLEPLIVAPAVLDSVISDLVGMTATLSDAPIRDMLMAFVNSRSSEVPGIDLRPWSWTEADEVGRSMTSQPAGTSSAGA